MNTQDEAQEAMSDYRLGKNGFEKAPGWQSVDVRNARNLPQPRNTILQQALSEVK